MIGNSVKRNDGLTLTDGNCSSTSGMLGLKSNFQSSYARGSCSDGNEIGSRRFHFSIARIRLDLVHKLYYIVDRWWCLVWIK